MATIPQPISAVNALFPIRAAAITSTPANPTSEARIALPSIRSPSMTAAR